MGVHMENMQLVLPNCCFFSSFTESFPMGPYMDRVKDGV